MFGTHASERLARSKRAFHNHLDHKRNSTNNEIKQSNWQVTHKYVVAACLCE